MMIKGTNISAEEAEMYTIDELEEILKEQEKKYDDIVLEMKNLKDGITVLNTIIKDKNREQIKMNTTNVAFVSKEITDIATKGYTIEIVAMIVVGKIPVRVVHRESMIQPSGVCLSDMYDIITDRLVKLSTKYNFIDVSLSEIDNDVFADNEIIKEKFRIHKTANPCSSAYVFND